MLDGKEDAFEDSTGGKLSSNQLLRKLHCEDYVHTFSLRPFLRLGVQVQKLSHDRSKRCWRLALNDGTCEDFDFVVLAIGNFSEKFIPEVSGVQNFMGHILHSCDLVDAQLLRNHHVVVVGYGKSALESCYNDMCKW